MYISRFRVFVAAAAGEQSSGMERWTVWFSGAEGSSNRSNSGSSSNTHKRCTYTKSNVCNLEFRSGAGAGKV